jgi:Tfp pilus assembly protein PilX
MCFHQSTKTKHPDSGSALVIALIVLAILAALGITALDVADLNLFTAANDRDNKEAFFHADSGVNIGHVFLEKAIGDTNSTFYDIGNNTTNANFWGNSTDFGPAAPNNPPAFHTEGIMTTRIRAGWLDNGVLEGAAMQIGAGYEGAGKGAASGGTFTNYLIRAHRVGRRNSQAVVDLGWRHINR